MTETQNNTAPVKALLFGLDLGEYDMEKSMEELAALAEAAGMEAVAEVVQKRAAPEAATYLGGGAPCRRQASVPQPWGAVCYF